MIEEKQDSEYCEARIEMLQERNIEESTRKNVRVNQIIWKNRQEQQCAKCPRKDNLTLDHIIPKELALSFGVDFINQYWEENFQMLCKPCNVFKSGRLDFSNLKTKVLLLKLIELI